MTFLAISGHKNPFPKITSPWREGGYEIYNPYRCYMPNLVKNGPVLLEKMLTDDDERQNTAIGHPSDSCNLKTLQIYKAIRFIRGELISHFC